MFWVKSELVGAFALMDELDHRQNESGTLEALLGLSLANVLTLLSDCQFIDPLN